jgi:hypothetical protein
MASAFPTTWWYVNGQRVKCQPRLEDLRQQPVHRGVIAGQQRIRPQERRMNARRRPRDSLCSGDGAASSTGNVYGTKAVAGREH